MKKYKIGQTIKRNNFEENPKDWPEEGTLLPIEIDGKLVAKYEVKQVDEKFIYGIVTNTYDHKRRK